FVCEFGFGKKRIADMGAGCPHIPARRARTAARARKICWGRNQFDCAHRRRLSLSQGRWFRPQRPPLPRQGTPPEAGLGSTTFRQRSRYLEGRQKSFSPQENSSKNEKFEDNGKVVVWIGIARGRWKI